MALAPDPPVVRIGDFLLDRSTGEVRDSSGSRATRLAPQPAKLLELLIEKNGELATREEIRARVWPETHIDFDQSLHFCVRQIRAAFGDSATEPTYVETLPRRGYRLALPVEPAAGSAGASGRVASPITKAVAGAAVALAIAALLLAILWRKSPPAAGPVRLAIMPFELAVDGSEAETLARISERLLVNLANGSDGRIDVIGPRSTAVYSAFPFPDLGRMADELEIDYVLNARLSERDGESQLIIELISLADRSHPWVDLYESTAEWAEIVRDVEDGVRAVLTPEL